MTGGHLPPNHHISRYCGGSHISENGEIASTAFFLRQDEKYLSVNWLESTDKDDRRSQVNEVCRRLELAIGSTAKIVILNVGEICEHVKREVDVRISVLHEPKLKDFSHSGIYNTAENELIIAELIAEKIIYTYLAVEFL